MLIGFSLAGLPSRVTLPVTVPAVEASTVFPAGAVVAAGCSAVSLLSFLPQPVMAMARTAASARWKYLLLIAGKASLCMTGYSNNFV